LKDTQENFLSKAAECQHLDSTKKKILQILFYKLLSQSEKTALKRKHVQIQKDKSTANDYNLKKNKTENDELPKNQERVKIELSKTSRPHRHSDSSSGSFEDKFDILCRIMCSKLDTIKDDLMAKFVESDGKIKQFQNQLAGLRNKLDSIQKKAKGKKNRRKKEETESDEEFPTEESEECLGSESDSFEEELRITRRRR